MAADWSTDVIDAVERWIAVTGGPGRTETSVNLGSAIPGDDGWLVLDLRDGTRNPGTFLDPCFAGEHGPERDLAYPVEELRNEDGVLVVRMPAGLPEHSRHLWVRSMPPRFLLDKLLHGLRAAGSAPLAQALAEKRLAGTPTSRAAAPELRGAQVDAFRACLSPGVRLVWGPPGTGKTQVLASAIEELVRQDKRVLLVSGGNVAVDNALHAVVQRMSPPPGVAIRVGPPHLKEIAGDANVQLDRLAGQASREVDEQRDAIANQLRDFEEVDAQITQLNEQLRDYDESTYRAAAARLAAEREVDDLGPRVREAEVIAHNARRAVVSAATELHEALAARAEVNPVRDALQHERDARARLAALEQRRRTLQLDRAALDARELPTGWRARRRHRREVAAADDKLRRFVDAATEGRRRWLDVQLQARAVIGGHGTADVDRVDLRVADAEGAMATAGEEYRRSRDVLIGLRRAIEEARARGRPTDEDRYGVADAEARDLPARHAQLRELITWQGTAERRRSLEDQHRTLVDRARLLRANAEAQIVREARVVATTLARSRIHPALTHATFDVVLVDEAGAAALAEVLLALCRATTTAVLFGDFLQLGPVLEPAVQNDPSLALQRWVCGTCFSHIGIESPADLAGQDGCVALTHQFRFGAGLRRLANDTVYEVLRDAEELPGIAAQPRTDVVLVDVSTVPDLATVRLGAVSGKWWAAGAVLSRALATQHVRDGPVGVVVPYTVQADATLAALRDQELSLGTAVGTVHSLQGREFPTVVFDLVEDGRGWVAEGRRGGSRWASDVLRMFGVGITRARSRLYLIADGRAVQTASTGPLRALRDALDRGEVRTWSAAALLGMAEPVPGPVDTTFTEVSALLRQLVTVTDVPDERTYGQELERHLAAAQESVWMWAPWVAHRAQDVVPLIQGAACRGVRVRVFVRPDTDSLMAKPAAQRQLPGLLVSGATVIRSDHEHRKIIVIDERVVLLGSLNTLSNASGRTREIMISIVGRAFAGRLLEELQAKKIGRPRPCERCSEIMEVRRGRGRAADLHWRCPSCRIRVPEQRRNSPRFPAGPRSGRGSTASTWHGDAPSW